MPEDIVLVPGTLSGVCYTTEQQRFEDYVSSISAQLAGTIPEVVIGSSTPSPDDQDKVWIRLDPTGPIIGLYYYVDGEWVGSRNPFEPNFIQQYYGSSTDVPLLSYGTVDDPFWRVCDGTEGTPDLRGKFILGTGTLESGLVVELGDTAGEERHTLIGPESGKLACITVTDDGDAQTGGLGSLDRLSINGIEVLPFATGPNVTTNTTTYPADQDPHNNMPPYFGALYIIRTARLF